MQPMAAPTTDTRLPQGMGAFRGGTVLAEAKQCSACAQRGMQSPMRVLHQYSAGGKDIQVYECMVCLHHDDVQV